MGQSSITLELGKEYIGPHEVTEVEHILSAVTANMERTYPPGKRPALRDAHAKTHGCVSAEFVVRDDLPQSLRHGVFSEPRTYQAWVRFSGGTPAIQSDTKREIHGMAIKLLGVPGEKLIEAERHETTQDFVMADHSVYFVRNLPDYVQFATRAANGKPLAFFIGWNPFRWHLRELFILLRANMKRVSNPLGIRYWSQTPYKLGPNAIKFSATPRNPAGGDDSVIQGDNSLQTAMQNQLRFEVVCFDFSVQVQTDPIKMPVEDSTVDWSEQDSPFVKVAQIRIPMQDPGSPERLDFAENLSFTPWHSLESHRPLGSINRTRLRVYETVSILRHKMNAVPRTEPTSTQ